MSSRVQAKGRRRRKTITYIWAAALSLVVIGLIYYEQTALLYILATLGVTALLIVVAVSDLHGADTSASSGSDDVTTGTGNKLRSTFGGTPSSNN